MMRNTVLIAAGGETESFFAAGACGLCWDTARFTMYVC